MKAAVLSLAALAALVAAAPDATQTAASANPTCAAENIVDACLGTENALLASCQTTDYDCQCHAYQAIVQCVPSSTLFSPP